LSMTCASSVRCTPISLIMRRRSSSSTRGRPSRDGPAWARGPCMAWEPRPATCLLS
jgi:hypothetical protein